MKTHGLINTLGFCLALLVFSTASHAQGGEAGKYQEGLHYFLIEGTPVKSGDTIVLEEAFSYLCTHCNTFDPYVENWKKRKPEYVDFRRIPVGFGRGSWELYARGYVTAQMMNVPDEAHVALMDRIWKEKNIIRNMDLNGKYRITGNAAVASYDAMFDVVDYLIAQEAASMQQASVASD